MKYFNPNYWFNLLLLSACLSENKANPVSKEYPILPSTPLICTHEAGHALNVMESSFKDYFKNITIYKERDDFAGVTNLDFSDEKKHDGIEKDIDKLKELIRIKMGGYAADMIAFPHLPKQEIINHSLTDFRGCEVFIEQINEITPSRPNEYKTFQKLREFLLVSELNKAVAVIQSNFKKFKEIIQKCTEFGYVDKKMFDDIADKYSKKASFNADKINDFGDKKDFINSKKAALSKIEL